MTRAVPHSFPRTLVVGSAAAIPSLAAGKEDLRLAAAADAAAAYDEERTVAAIRAALDTEVVDRIILEHAALSGERAALVRSWCEAEGIGLTLASESPIPGMPPQDARVGSELLWHLEQPPGLRHGGAAKRVLDVALALVLLALSLPLIAIAALLIKATSRGPVLFVQERVGRRGRRFRLYKLRTMIEGAEAQRHSLSERNERQGPPFKMRRDPRVTRVGRILRRFSIDEVPQLLNVLRDEMSIVGPRPPTPDEVGRYEPWHRRRLAVKPGLTCTWQVSGRGHLEFDEWVRLDLEYIDRWTLWRDLCIMVRTIPAVLTGRGAW
jgi:exopolysaccharide biosynthesis polyprenyl glycosylphosphotransferase